MDSFMVGKIVVGVVNKDEQLTDAWYEETIETWFKEGGR